MICSIILQQKKLKCKVLRFFSFIFYLVRAAMFDWFDEPMVYYRRFAPMRSGVFDYMSRWMDSVDRAMEQ